MSGNLDNRFVICSKCDIRINVALDSNFAMSPFENRTYLTECSHVICHQCFDTAFAIFSMNCRTCNGKQSPITSIKRVYLQSAQGPPSDHFRALEEELKKAEREKVRLEAELAVLRAQLEESTQTVKQDLVELKSIMTKYEALVGVYDSLQ